MKKSYPDITALLLRIAFGALMLPHGYKKIEKLQAAYDRPEILESIDVLIPISSDPLGIGEKATLIIAIIVELVFASLVILGVKVRITTLPLIATMGVAAFLVHADAPFAKKELALLFLAGYLAIFALGAGKYSFKKLR